MGTEAAVPARRQWYDPSVVKELRPLWVDTVRDVDALAERCAEAGVFAVDTEADSLHSYFHKVCLIQVSVGDQNTLVDPLAVRERGLRSLMEVVGDPGSTVLMHGADYDIRVLDRDFKARVGGLLDTQIMAQILGEPKTGLAALLEIEFGIRLDKKYQRADWGRRPLSREMAAYAAADTAFLAGLADRLRSRLTALGRWSWVTEDCRRLETVRHAPPADDPYAFERVKGVTALRGEARDRAFTVWRWRESEARRRDLPPFKVLGNPPLVAMAIDPPKNPGELAQLNGVGPRFVRHSGAAVINLLHHPEAAPARRSRRTDPAPDSAVRARSKKLRAARDAIAQKCGVEPGLLCPKATLLAVSNGERAPESIPELEARGLSGWRLDLLGSPFLKALADEQGPH